jgi:hypothetical protein
MGRLRRERAAFAFGIDPRQNLGSLYLVGPAGCVKGIDMGEDLRRWAGAARLAVLLLALAMILVSPVLAQGQKSTIIRVEIAEVHDRLTPDFEPDIKWTHNFVITMSGKNSIAESRTNTFAGSPQHPATQRRVSNLTSQSDRETTLGRQEGKATWQVLGPKKLRRIWAGQQFIMLWEIEIGDNNSCSIDAKYLLQKGFHDTIGRRAGTGTMEHFSIQRIQSATCSIQAS